MPQKFVHTLIGLITLYDWKKAAMASGIWADADNIAKVAPRKSDPGTGSGGKLIDKKLLKNVIYIEMYELLRRTLYSGF